MKTRFTLWFFQIIFIQCCFPCLWLDSYVTTKQSDSSSGLSRIIEEEWVKNNINKIIQPHLVAICKILAFTRFYDYKYEHSTSRRSISEVFLDTSGVRATKVSEVDGTVLLGKVKAVLWQWIHNAYPVRTQGRGKQKMQKVNRNTRMSLPLGKRESRPLIRCACIVFPEEMNSHDQGKISIGSQTGWFVNLMVKLMSFYSILSTIL